MNKPFLTVFLGYSAEAPTSIKAELESQTSMKQTFVGKYEEVESSKDQVVQKNIVMGECEEPVSYRIPGTV